MTQETPEQASDARTEEHQKQRCPDPTEPFTEYVIDAAVAKKEADLYAADVEVVRPRYEKLKGAQTRYSDAKQAQKAAFEELKQRLLRIKDNLGCTLTEAEREELIRCWKKLLEETQPPYADVKCGPIDIQDPDNLPKGRQELTDLLKNAEKCAARADERFDQLITLPDDLPAKITGLAERATKLEQSVCTAPKELMRRHYVEYLELNRDFEALDSDWTDPTEYGCRLKRYFRALLRRHILVIAIRVALERLDQQDAQKEVEKTEKKNNLIDFVLGCAQPPQEKPGGCAKPEQSAPTQQPAQQSATIPAAQAQQTAPDEEEV